MHFEPFFSVARNYSSTSTTGTHTRTITSSTITSVTTMDPALPEALDFQRFASQRKIHPTISPKGTVTDLESLNPLGDFFGPKFGVCSQFAFFLGGVFLGRNYGMPTHGSSDFPRFTCFNLRLQELRGRTTPIPDPPLPG